MSRLTIFITVCLAAGTVQGQSILLVDDTATGANNGSSWCDAYVYLQNALASVSAPSEIRVAQGIYKPDQGVGQTPGDRAATFQLLDGVTLKGGYAGCGEADPDTRDVTLYQTVLSGDLTGNDGPDFENNDENVYHVVTGSFTDTTAVLDGFTIVGGNAAGPFAAASLLAEVSPQGRASVFADGDSRTESGEICGGWSGECDPGKFCKLPVGRCCCDYNGVCTVPPYSCPPAWNPVCGCDGITYANECWADAASMSLNNHGACPNGGGIFNHLGSPTVSDCTFRGNSAYWSGGAMYTYQGNPAVTRCIFEENSAKWGGAVYNYESDTLMHDCALRGNSAGSGGAMENWYSSPVLEGCEFTRNSSGGHGAGIFNFNGDPTLIDCIFEGNVSQWGSGGGMYNNHGSVSVINSIFFGNSATGSALGGGGLLNGDIAVLSNCTFLGNSAQSGGGIYNWVGGSLTLSDSIMWDNSDGGGMDESAQIHNNGGSTVVTYSCVQGLDIYAGNGNVGGDPLHVPGPRGCFYLSQTAAGQMEQSPCVDAGSDTAQQLGLETMTTRSDEGADTGIVDMGYHYPITGDALINVEAVGSRFMKFSLSNPMPGTAKPTAILVTSPLDSCPNYYVQPDGSLGLDPVFLSADEWNNGGDGKYLSSPYITPETEFTFQRAVDDCEGLQFPEPPVSDMTWALGDIDNNALVNVADVQILINLIQCYDNMTHQYTCENAFTVLYEPQNADQWGMGDCAPHGFLNVQDVQITQLVIQMGPDPSNYSDLLANFPDCSQDPCPVD